MKRFVVRLGGRAGPGLHAVPAAHVYDCYRVLFRGYIANLRALIDEARRRAEPLRDRSDAELFAKAYQWWGAELQSRVLGEYAVAIFDERRSRLLLTHDALGLVPLFYTQSPDGFVFASHLGDLVSQTGIADLDEEYIADYLRTCGVISSRTPYAGVSRLLPGQTLLWTDQQISIRKTWEIGRAGPITLASDAEFEERFRSLLQEGVTASLRCDGKVWSELSGGLDSSSVVSVAAHSGAQQLEAISVIYSSSKSADEREWINAVVRKYRLPWHTLDGDEARPFTELPGPCAEPFGALPGAGLFRLYNALAEANGVHVVLSGVGGDQVFCGDSPRPYFLADLLPFQWNRLLAALRQWRVGNLERRSYLHLFQKNVLGPLLRHLLRRNIGNPDVIAVPPWLDPDYRRVMRVDRRGANQLAPRCRSVGQQYLAERIWKVGLSSGDDGKLAFEFRYPLLYRPLVEFMLAIPWQQIIQPGQDRYLQRRALRGILPEEVRRRTDKGGPAEAEFKGLQAGGAWIDLLLNRPLVVERGYVHPALWREAVNRARFGRVASMRHFVATATLEIWLRQLEDNQRSTPSCYAAQALLNSEASTLA